MGEKYFTEIGQVNIPEGKWVLVLPGWYPTWQDPFTGDFNQRHVHAAGMHAAQVVLYIVKDQTGALGKNEIRYIQSSDKIVEIIIIYPARKNKIFDSVHSNLQFLHLLYKHANIISENWGKPFLLHSYIVIRGGLAGLLLSKKFKVPFILSENWTIYYPEDPRFFKRRNGLFKAVVKQVFRSVDRFLPVTVDLQKKVESLFDPVPSTVIPNVVETGIFNRDIYRNKIKPFRFIHVSTMSYQKNPEGLLRAFKKFNESNPGSTMWMVGPYPEAVPKYAQSVGLDDHLVHFTGSVSYREVSTLIKECEALVLFSRYENLPCVILEALCCGLPIISTSVGGIAEVIDNTNGVLIDNENEEQLAAALSKVFTQYNTFNPPEISNLATALYSYQSVGQQ